MSEILDVVPVTDSKAHWLILDCGHTYKWSPPNPPPEVDAEFPCPSCAPLPNVITAGAEVTETLRAADCTLVKAATDAERLQMLTEVSQSQGYRASVAKAQLASEVHS